MGNNLFRVAALATIISGGIMAFQAITADEDAAQSPAAIYANNYSAPAKKNESPRKVGNGRVGEKTTNDSNIDRPANQSQVSNECAPTQGNNSIAICGDVVSEKNNNISTGN